MMIPENEIFVHYIDHLGVNEAVTKMRMVRILYFLTRLFLMKCSTRNTIMPCGISKTMILKKKTCRK